MPIRTAQFQIKSTLPQALLLALVVIATCATSGAAQAKLEHKKVLILSSTDSFSASGEKLEKSLRSTLQKGSPHPLDIYSEYLDGARTETTSYEIELVALLRRKYEDRKFDLIYTITEPALPILLKYRNELFPDVPVVFLTVDQRGISDLNLGQGVTGVWGEINLKPNLDLALSLHPGTKRVVVIAGLTAWDKYWTERAREDYGPYESSLEFTYLIGLTSAEQREALSRLPPQSVVIFITSVLDREGNTYDNKDLLAQISPASTAPIYGTTDTQLGAGVVGGSVLSFEALGVEGGRVGLRLLAGERPDAIPPHGVPSVDMFDWRELQQWGVSEQQLPAGSKVDFKVPSFWERYKWYIIGTFTLLVLQSSLIAILLLERKRRQRAKDALDQLNAELEARIASRTEALAGKTRELETFSYSVAHDLKAPLRGIEGYSRLLLEDHAAELNDEGRSFLETIHGSTEEMNALIDDLLEYSRLERREFKQDRVELGPLITSVVEQKKRQTSEAAIDFIVKVNGGSVVADQSGLTQSLRNYIDNAVKFTGKVSNPRIEVGSNETAKSFVVWVKDNGVGFDMKYHDRIFNIFQRLNSGEEYSGTGIGLAIVRKAMERMGGRAWAESQPGQGATFYLQIPK